MYAPPILRVNLGKKWNKLQESLLSKRRNIAQRLNVRNGFTSCLINHTRDHLQPLLPPKSFWIPLSTRTPLPKRCLILHPRFPKVAGSSTHPSPHLRKVALSSIPSPQTLLDSPPQSNITFTWSNFPIMHLQNIAKQKLREQLKIFDAEILKENYTGRNFAEWILLWKI